ncbi:MAG: hypothetical protein WCT41_02050 [Candidatus Paceibacterota bacterium]|jgi:hypothetical protein
MRKISKIFAILSFWIGICAILFGISGHSIGLDRPIFAFDSSPTPINPDVIFWSPVIGVAMVLFSMLIFVVSGGLRNWWLKTNN